MSELADSGRIEKRGWARPGGAHDLLVNLLKIILPALIGVLMAYLALSPLTKSREISFILDKSKVEVAKERMRVQSAQYRGQDNLGRAFTLNADSAVQVTSQDPIVDIEGMAAEIRLAEGPASLKADKARYDMDAEKVKVIGPILFAAADGYQLKTRDVAVDLNSRTMASDGRVDGLMPLGRFSADRLVASLPERRVVLTGRARLHIVQGGLR